MKTPSEELFAAAKQNNVQIAKSVLARGLVDVNVRDESFKGTPLHYACIKGNFEVARLLVDTYKANVNVVTSQNCSPLHYSSIKGHLSVSRLLVKFGADTNVVGKDGDTPLHYAARKGFPQVVSLLLDHGADYKKENDAGQTPRKLAQVKGKYACVQRLEEEDLRRSKDAKDAAEKQSRKAVDSQGYADEVTSALVDSLENSLGSTVSSLGSSFNREDREVDAVAETFQKQAGFSAAAAGHDDVLEKAVKKAAFAPPAPPDAGDGIAFKPPKDKMALSTTARGANTSKKESSSDMKEKSNGSKPLKRPKSRASSAHEDRLIQYIKEKNLESVIGLLDRHPELVAPQDATHPMDGCRDTDQNTPLHYACAVGVLEIVKVVIEAGADLNSPNKFGSTPLHEASDRNFDTIVDHLLLRGAKATCVDLLANSPLHYCSSKGHVATCKLLLQGNADVTAVGEHGYTPLHLAAMRGHPAIIVELLDFGADPTRKSEAGWTPLQLAKRSKHPRCVQKLEHAYNPCSKLNIGKYRKTKRLAREKSMRLRKQASSAASGGRA